MLAEDVEIAAGPVQPYGQGAHQRHVQTLALQLTPQGRAGEQGVSGALALVAVGAEVLREADVAVEREQALVQLISLLQRANFQLGPSLTPCLERTLVS